MDENLKAILILKGFKNIHTTRHILREILKIIKTKFKGTSKIFVT